MKKILLTIAIIFATITPSNAGLLDSILTGDFPTKKSVAYKVEAYGYDFRVYEWQADVPNTTCILALGESGYAGLQCFSTKN